MHPLETARSKTNIARSDTSRPASVLSQRSSNAPSIVSSVASKSSTPAFRRNNNSHSPPQPTPLIRTKLIIRPGQTAARPALRSKDNNENVPSLTTATATATKRTSITPRLAPVASRMPPGDRPRPQLSAAAAKSINRTPLTPKIATKAVPVVTPIVKRTQTPSVVASQPAKDDTATTPVAGNGALALGNNVTPRSGKRQSRVDSANSTPSGTPIPDRTANEALDSNRLSTALPSLAFGNMRQSPPLEGRSDGENKFFYASDARNSQPSSRPASTVSQKSATFFYANAAPVNDTKRRLSPPANSTLSPSPFPNPEPAASKFFYANGTPNSTSRPSFAPSSSGSTVSSASRVPVKRPGTTQSSLGAPTANPKRPISPIKAASTPNTHTLKSSSTPHLPQTRAQLASPPTLAPVAAPRSRGVTIDNNAAPASFRSHSRGPSIPTIEPLPGPRLTIPNSASPEPVSPPLSPGLMQPAMTMASLLQAVEDLPDKDEGDDSTEGDAQTESLSPTKSVFSNDAISELVANARRERKVQDLEITNASLEAINRTLERQLRKQTAELRRYRRLSRAGRISFASAASSRVTSTTMTEPLDDASDFGNDDLYGSEEEEDSLEDEFDSSSGTESGSITDANSPSDKLVARRKREEKRLQLDLTKHQELLVDSQKMNQSIKRCLDWSEMLIKEGQKALEYNVRVSDVELGGHVLTPFDEDEEDVSFATNIHDEMDSLVEAAGELQTDLVPPWNKGAQDRDSGIELPAESSS